MEEELAEEPVCVISLAVHGGCLRLVYLLCILTFHACFEGVHRAGYLGGAARGRTDAASRLRARAPAAPAAGSPRACSPSEAAALAGGLSWSLEAEATTAYLPASALRADILPLNASAPAPLEFVPRLGSGCSLRAMSPLRMRQCLRGRGVMLVGDSVTRYQYLNLAQSLETGLHIPWDPPTEHDNLHGTWANFFAATTERLGGHSACDCWRPPNDWPQEVCRGGLCAWAVLGSRYYAWPEAQLELTFLEALGGAKAPPAAVWHEPAEAFGFHCGKAAAAAAAEGRDPALPARCAVPASNGSAAAAALGPACAPGECASPPDHVDALWDAIRAMVLRTRPAILVVNSGLWGIQWQEGEGGNVARLMGALDWAVSSKGGVEVAVWKTTTHQITGDLREGAFDDTPLRTQREHLVVEAFRARGWPVLDAAEATRELAARAVNSSSDREHAFIDAVHFTRSIYRALNELLVSIVCGNASWGAAPAHARRVEVGAGEGAPPARTAAMGLTMAHLDGLSGLAHAAFPHPIP